MNLTGKLASVCNSISGDCGERHLNADNWRNGHTPVVFPSFKATSMCNTTDSMCMRYVLRLESLNKAGRY